MKKAGIIGGLSTVSTELFYREINLCAQKREPVEYPALLINSVSLEDFIPYLNDKKNLIKSINNEIGKIHEHVDVLAIICNTVHYVIDEIREFSNVPVLAIHEEVGKVLDESKVKKIGLLGTKTTIDQHLYQNELMKTEVQFEVLDIEEMEELDKLIFKEIIFGRGHEKMKPLAKKYIEFFENKGCDSILLACTELSLFFSQDDTRLRLFSTLKILAESVFEYVSQNNKNIRIA